MTDPNKIVLQVRAEVGEIIHSWVLLRHFRAVCASQATGDHLKDMKNANVQFLRALATKLANELISRLAELGDTKARRKVTFAHALRRLQGVGVMVPRAGASTLQVFLTQRGFEAKRNKELSHREFVEEWDDERAPIHIPDSTICRAIAMAVRLMKRIDHYVYGGVHASFMWGELRRRRHRFDLPPGIAYMIAEHVRVPEAVRARIIQDEIRRGVFHQELIETVVNGTPVSLYASKKWGAINLAGEMLVLPQYPLLELKAIDSERIRVEQ